MNMLAWWTAVGLLGVLVAVVDVALVVLGLNRASTTIVGQFHPRF
jgi:hypothetical protein